jgi:hypothetical protein
MRSGSVFAITVDVDFDEDVVDESVHQVRMNELIGMVGEQKIPLGTRPANLAGWGFADTCRKIMNNEIDAALSIRNAPNEPWSHLKYEQLFNIHYADRSKMLTIGGILLDRDDFGKLSAKDFDDLEFVSKADEAYRIYAPVLTTREVHYLNGLLPRSNPDVDRPTWLPQEDRKKFGKVYRYYPAYTEVEI